MEGGSDPRRRNQMIPKYSVRQGPISYERCREHEAEADTLAQMIHIVGVERFQKIQQLFGGQRIWIPKSGAEQPCRRCPDRDRRIHDLRLHGARVVELAERFGLSPKRVYGILEGINASNNDGSRARGILESAQNGRPVRGSATNGNCTASGRILSYVK